MFLIQGHSHSSVRIAPKIANFSTNTVLHTCLAHRCTLVPLNSFTLHALGFCDSAIPRLLSPLQIKIITGNIQILETMLEHASLAAEDLRVGSFC